MNINEQRAVLNIMIHAALADGRKSEDERTAIRDAAESLVTSGGATLAGVYQDVLLKRVTLESAAAALPELEHRQLAYEMAVCVIDADGVQSEGETAFLVSLRQRLGLEGDETANTAASRADAIAAAAYAPAAVPSATSTLNTTSDAALDKRILNYAILNGALELLPQSWASMAIIPLQVRMVYRIGQSYGVNLDQGHIKEFLATLGVGLTSQYVEQIGRKLVGGLLGKAAGGMIGGLGRAATGMAFSFATTYALGHLAKRYYAGGRVMSTALLRSTYQDLLASAKGTQQQYIPAIRERASTLTPTEVMRLVKE
ncbi:MAG: DUF533 domain-containing protein [Gammaproteobacteria bacterium]|jgi:uncharacterized protein (DUF697 family)/tellurite resistance protein|nr:DUF533 domain-containing protein [Gammaproteobacteria bacterium]